MPFRNFPLFGLGFLLTPALQAQQITGLVKNDKGNVLSHASVVLKNANDSFIVKTDVTNSSGQYRFTNIPSGSYFINASFTGYMPAKTGIFEVEKGLQFQLPELRLTRSDGYLANVSVTAARSPVEVTMNKTILYIEGSVNAAGQDGLELLKKAPGVSISQDDKINLNSKSGVQVYVDEKRIPLSGSELAAYLKSLQSSSIEAIEVISNPSAKYESAGSAGIINIRLKKDKSLGTNGSLSGGYNIGIYSKYNGGLSFNHRNKHLNIFGNLYYNGGIKQWSLDTDRLLPDTIFKHRSVTTTHYNTQSFKAGIDYFISKNSVMGLMINGGISQSSVKSLSNTYITYLPANQPVKQLTAHNSTISRRVTQSMNLNYRYADTLRREWNIDADYGFFRTGTDQLQPNIYYNPEGTTVLESRIYQILTPTYIDISTLKSDYAQEFMKGRLAIGGKLALVKSQNRLEQYSVRQPAKTLDSSHTNTFFYKENINALYVNYNRPFNKLKVQLGLRIENTNTKADYGNYNRENHSYRFYNSSFARNYTDFFPNTGISYATTTGHEWQVMYGRRIDRPDYQTLNPFEYRLDEYTFERGNKDIKPQYAGSLSISYSYRSKLTAGLTYSNIKDAFGVVIDTLNVSKSFLTYRNLTTQRMAGASISYSLQVKRYSLFTNCNGNFIHLKADLGVNRMVDISVFTWSVSQQHTFHFGKGWAAEIYASYASPKLWGINKSIAVYYADGGLQKKLFKGKMYVKASMTDLFATMLYGNSNVFAGQQNVERLNKEFRQFKLNVTYNLGSKEVKAARQRNTGLEEERTRAGN